MVPLEKNVELKCRFLTWGLCSSLLGRLDGACAAACCCCCLAASWACRCRKTFLSVLSAGFSGRRSLVRALSHLFSDKPAAEIPLRMLLRHVFAFFGKIQKGGGVFPLSFYPGASCRAATRDPRRPSDFARSQFGSNCGAFVPAVTPTCSSLTR